MTQQTRFTQTNRVPCQCPCHAHIRTVNWAPRGSPSQRYLPALRVSLFHNTWLLSPDRGRCFLFPIPPAPRKYPPTSRAFLFHNTRLLSPDHVRCTIIKIFNSPAFHSRVVKFLVPASFPQTPRPPPHTHQNLLGRAHTHTLPRSKP